MKSFASLLGRCALALASVVALPTAGCLSTGEPDGGENLNSADQSFEAFEATVYREPGTGVYIVNGDTPIATKRELLDFYIRYVQAGALIIGQENGVDVKWDEKQKLALTYCVSKSFGSRYSDVVNAMAEATSAWTSVASVAYSHVAAEDANCTATNSKVLFDVNPTSGQSYLARSFFPNTARAARNVLIDDNAFGDIGAYTLGGVLRHELGHTLGFRHEHTRKEAGACFEDDNWRPLTDYDADSVMHYPQCNGTNKGDLVLTAKDAMGASSLYGAPGGGMPTGGSGTCAHDPCTAGERLDPSCDKAATSVCGSDNYCCSTKWDAVCVTEAKNAGATCGVAESPPAACAHDICAAGEALNPACDACAKQVIVADNYCGSIKWDATCAKEAAQVCGAPCQ